MFSRRSQYKAAAELKKNMNTKRINFNIPENHVVITKSWLLGFIEGDGSFSLERTSRAHSARCSAAALGGGGRTSFYPVFSIKLTEKQLTILLKIKEYLESNLGFDLYSMHKLKSTSVISIKSEKASRSALKCAAAMQGRGCCAAPPRKR